MAADLQRRRGGNQQGNLAVLAGHARRVIYINSQTKMTKSVADAGTPNMGAVLRLLEPLQEVAGMAPVAALPAL